MVELEKSTEYTKILFAIQNGNRTLSQIADSVNKSKPTILNQIKRLEKKEYIQPTESKSKGYSVKWKINKDHLISYWQHAYKKEGFDGKAAKELFNFCFGQVAAIPPLFPLTIESIGQLFLITQNVQELSGGNIMEMPLKELMLYSKHPEYKKRALKNYKQIIKKRRKAKK